MPKQKGTASSDPDHLQSKKMIEGKVILCISHYDLEVSLPTLIEMIKGWQTSYGSDCILDIEKEYGYDQYDCSFNFSLKTYREETDEEFAKRIEKNDKAKKARLDRDKLEKQKKKEREKADLERLIKKYPELANELQKGQNE